MQKSKIKITIQNFKIIFAFLIATFFIMFSAAHASIGVGVNLGKIVVDKQLKPGGIYYLPAIGVINTGDEKGDYEMEVTYHQDQPELKPEQAWFQFEPSAFWLKAGESQNVAVKLSLPLIVKPGNYFAYLEAHPLVKTKSGGASIGVAAATKTYFTVVPANIWQAMYYKFVSLFSLYSPWSYVTLAVAAGAAVIVLIRRFLTFQIRIERK